MKTWDDLYLEMVYLVASKSEDPRCHIGAVIVSENNELISIGYNGLPRGVRHTRDKNIKPGKFYFFEHAERNAIYNALRNNISTINSKIYTNGIPCADCARAIIQTGIKLVIIDIDWPTTNSEYWKNHFTATKILFGETGVEMRFHKLQNKAERFQHGKVSR